MTRTNEVLAYIVLAAVGILGPVFFENYIQQIAVLWIMVLMASTWDITGGQMGYNSLGNITFFGAGMYISAVVQISMGYDVAEYTAAFGAIKVDFTDTQYFTGIALGIIAGGIGAFLIAILRPATRKPRARLRVGAALRQRRPPQASAKELGDEIAVPV